MASKTGNIIKYSLSFLLAGVLVWFAFRGMDWKAFLDGLRLTRWLYIGLFFVAALVALVFRMLRWRAMLTPVIPDVTNKKTWDAANIGNLINVVLPGAGEFVRCGVVAGKGGAGYEKILGTIVMERIWDFLAVGVLFALSLALKWDTFGTFFFEQIVAPMTGRLQLNLGYLLLLFVLLLALGLWLIYRFRDRSRFCGRIVSGLKGLAQGLTSFLRMERKPLFLVYTALIWLIYVLMSYLVLKAVPGLDALSFTDALFLSAVGNIASVVPVPGGIGAFHYLLALSLSSLYAFSWETGILFATLSHEGHALLVIVLGLISYAATAARPGGK